jgi:hypothetical protein
MNLKRVNEQQPDMSFPIRIAAPQPPTKSHSPSSKHERAGLETPDALPLLPFFDVATNLPDGMFPQLDVSAASFVRNGSCPGTISCSFRIWQVRRLRRAKDKWSISLHRAKDKLVEKLGVEPRTFST